jgi:hypothetical protein
MFSLIPHLAENRVCMCFNVRGRELIYLIEPSILKNLNILLGPVACCTILHWQGIRILQGEAKSNSAKGQLC